MSTAARLISGSAASWAQIAATVAAQIVLVPVYLNYWSVKTYGIWLAIQGIMSALSMLDLGHQNYMGFEFLRLGSKNILDLSKALWSAIVVSVLISVGQILLIVLFFFTGIMTFLLGESGTNDIDLINAAGIVLILQGISWLVVMSFSGLIVRGLAVFGYYPRMAWWGFVYTIITTLAPLIAVVMGGDLLMAGIALTLGAFLYALIFFVDLYKLLKKVRIILVKPSVALGISNFRKSTPLLGKALFENVRQQGVRLVLAPLAGATGLAAFSTMRTGANMALQGLNTIVNPMLPDLMRFLHDRDQARSEAAFATVWIVVVACIAPGVVLLQIVIEPLFLFWTQGKITFDPLLFALLSLGVLVYAVVQPAVAVVIGNNLTKIQLWLSAFAALTVLVLLAILVPVIGIIGAAIALLAAEVVAAVGYKFIAERWLRENNLRWPKRPFYIALLSVVIAAAGLVCIILLPHLKWVTLSITLVLCFINLWKYWQVLPTVAIQSAKNIVNRVPGIKRLVFLLDVKWLLV
ncbi:polysaccharide biosynthesis C-terminal domain-containing protein [Chryseolinea sp. H1M3-3]|uniref:polysaccharide biosynthesis C-terminal domain-containing protein n=1 Tax=Chryseolinea sp. H1M3-3 TaxID=3034144 RepID=UPI0023EAC0D5|nr:polysaccharide biosynthesis C-terminal domain-containing protein [Chryseolinea sp. H1M3-3]